MSKERILIVVAHPDDEAIGCGGYIARKVDEGCDVKALFLTNGVSARSKSGKDDVARRRRGLVNSSNILKISQIFEFDFPDNEMDSVSLIKIVKSIESILLDFAPSIVVTHHLCDLNIDHQITHKAVLTACRPISGSSVKEILAFEVLSSTEWQSSLSAHKFTPNYFVDITDYMDKKISSLEAYGGEIRESPHSRSFNAIKALAILRGESVGYKYAESFALVRKLID